MGRHKKWRSIVKRERRRRKRIEKAIERNPINYLSKEEYQLWSKQQEELEAIELESITHTNERENEKWMIAEQKATEQWKKLQEIKDVMRLAELEKEIRQKLEWETEKEKRAEEERRMKEIEEINKKKQTIFLQHLEQFLLGKSTHPPPELDVIYETKPNCEKCPFFSKTACCRFGDQCSRNHQSPSISKILLARNFFVHFGLNNSNFNEYDTDLMLEFEDVDTYREFEEFFFDILPQFENFGKIRQLKVCKNKEKHLCGNTYVEFVDLRCAVAAYRALHGRWYGGRQLVLQFCNILSWKSAVCASQQNCPKGRSCNFLHIFRNPRNMFPLPNDRVPERTTPRSWRWSESPEIELPNTSSKKRHRSTTDDRQKSTLSHRHRGSTSKSKSKYEDRSRRSPTSPCKSRRRNKKKKNK